MRWSLILVTTSLNITDWLYDPHSKDASQRTWEWKITGQISKSSLSRIKYYAHDFRRKGQANKNKIRQCIPKNISTGRNEFRLNIRPTIIRIARLDLQFWGLTSGHQRGSSSSLSVLHKSASLSSLPLEL